MTPRPFGDASTEDRFARARARMVERQLRGRGIRDECVLAAMAELPRERFVPPELAGRAYDDGALAIGEGQTISQPWLVGAMVAILELRGDERVLEVGTGSGYSTAVLARCCREVVTIERHGALADRARAILDELEIANVEVRQGDGTKGAPDRAPFGGVVVTASAVEAPPRALFEQLEPGAALVCPVKRAEGEYLMRFRGGEEEVVASVRFVPLVSEDVDGEGGTAPGRGGTAPGGPTR